MRLLLSRPLTTYLLSASGVLLAASLLVASAADEKAKKSAAKSTAIKPEAVKLGRPVDFLKDVYPAIEQNCIACHNVAINESKLVLEEVNDLLKGGKRGTSIVAKQPDKSLLYLVASRQKKPHMPPLPNNQDAKAFTPRELGLLRQWILEGATGGTGGRKQMLQFAPLPDSARAIYSVAISPWNRFAAAGRANQVTIYDTRLGEKVATLVDPNLAAIKFGDKVMYPGGATHRDFVHSMSFSPSGDMLATGGYRVVKLWKRDPARQVAKLAGPSAVTATAISADGKTAAVATADNIIRLVNLADGKVIRELKGHTAAVSGLAFFPHPSETSRLAAGTAAAEAALATAVTAQKTTEKAAKDFDPKALKLEGDAIAAEKKKRTDAAAAAVKAVDAAKTALAAAKKTEAEFAKAAAEGSLLVSGSQDKSVRVWKVTDGSVVRQVATPAAVNDVAFTKDGARIVSAQADNLLRVWTTAKPKPAEKKAGDKKKKAADKKKDKDAKDAGEKPVLEIKGHTKPVTGVALILPAGTQIATSSGDNTVRIFDVTKGNQVRSINVGSPVSDVAVRPDGGAIAAAAGKFARLYDLAGKQLAELKGDLGLTRTLATATEEQSVNKQLVGVADGKQKAADKTSKDRTAAAKKAKDAKTAADKKVTEQKPKFDAAKTKSDAALKAFDAAAKGLVDAKKAAVDAAKKATDLKKVADDAKKLANTETKKSTDSAKTSETAKKAAADAAKKLTTATAADKKADEAIKAAGDDAAKKKAAEEAKKKTAAAVKTATEAKTKADKAATDAAKAATDAKKVSDAANKKSTDAATAAKTAAEAKTKADATSKTALTKNTTTKKAKDDTEKETAKQKAELKKTTDAQTSADRTQKLADKATSDAQATLKTANADKAAKDARQKTVDADVTKATAAIKTAEKPISVVAFSPDGKLLLTGGADQRIHVWYAAAGKAVEMIAGHTGAITSLSISPSGLVLSGSADKLAATWDISPRWSLAGQLGPKADKPLDLSESPFVSRVLSVDFSYDGKLLVTGGGDPSRSGELMIWDVAKKSLVKEFKDAHSDTVFGAEFSRDGTKLLSGAADKFVKIFDVASGKHIRSFEGHTHHVLDVSWKADNTSIASAGADNVIKVWNVDTGEQRRTIGGYSKQVTSLRFVGIGENVISCGGDKAVRYHKTGNGQNYRSFSGGTDFMYAAASSRDESFVVAGGEDGIVRLWNGKDAKLVKAFSP
jgi:WD40 repeat protein